MGMDDAGYNRKSPAPRNLCDLSGGACFCPVVLLTWRQMAFRSIHKISAIAILLCMIASSGCAGKPVVQGWLDSRGTIYRESEQEGFGSRTTVKVRGFEF
jgi:hypothetical protein